MKAASLSAACALAALFGAGPACADPSSWLFVGGGAGTVDTFGQSNNHALLQFETGLGSPADGAIAVGGMFKSLTFFSRGTDLVLAVRGATGGFVRGGFGVALDAGGYARFWERGSQGFAGAVVLGIPYGFQVAVQTEIGSKDEKTYAAVVGIDFLRLTVFRSVGQNWLPNPTPGFGAR